MNDTHNKTDNDYLKDISTSKKELANGEKIPVLGLGTYLATGSEVMEAVQHALEVGYRHIDTAAFYGNEEAIGKAINTSEIPREDIFVTTKLWNSDHGYEKALNAFQESYDKLGLEYIDLYLIHWPVQGLRMDSWKALEEIQQKGYCKSIGVSNYMTRHLEELLAEAEIKPVVNQVEFHPFLYQKELLDYCNQQKIQLEAYSPLTKARKLNHPTLLSIGKKYQKSTAQILIR